MTNTSTTIIDLGETQVKDSNGNTFINKWKITSDQKYSRMEALTIDYGKCGHSVGYGFGKDFAFTNKDQYTSRPQCMYCDNSDHVKALQKDPNSILYIKP